MKLGTAMTCVLVAFVVGAFAGYRYAVDRQAAQPPTALTTSVEAPAPVPATAMAPTVATPPTIATRAAAQAADIAATPPTLPRSMPPGPDPTQLSHAEFESAVTRLFEEEGEDPAWRAATESLLTNHFYRENPLGVGATMTSVECRASICKVEATSMEKDAQKVMGPRSTRWGDLIAFYSRSHNDVADGPTRFTLYLRPQAAFVAPSPHR